ncbi:hypothetical protein MAR_029900 [Mya arenaria]|uniref:Uncharacterized protein n=1 Tax=Mya arenaria TaxID=6604 RepID=A0ABY7DLJ3_MYAAR|nr:hypothetical protein MAR_029833 [Mya arenaria]WAQ97210.1 hypothetical protein MAR_029900 [Mya arenaria]
MFVKCKQSVIKVQSFQGSNSSNSLPRYSSVAIVLFNLPPATYMCFASSSSFRKITYRDSQLGASRW